MSARRPAWRQAGGGADPYLVGISFALVLITLALALGDYIRAVNALYYMRRGLAGSLRGAARMVQIEPWAQQGVLALDTDLAQPAFHQLLAENLGLEPARGYRDGSEVVLSPPDNHPYLAGPVRYRLRVVSGGSVEGLAVRMQFSVRLSILPLTPHYCLETVSYPTELGRPVRPGDARAGRCQGA